MITRIPRLFAAWAALLVCAPLLQAQTPGKTQHLDSPDQTPQGLAKSDWQNIRAAYEAGRHEFKPIEGGWQARNPGQQWTTKFDGRGFIATPREGDWTWGLELESYGRGADQRTVNGQPAVKAAGQRLSYQWDATVQEWWVNDQRGLEHGYTLAQRPEAKDSSDSSALSLLLATRGTLTPKVTPDALGVSFCDASGATVLNYAGLKVWDADGKVLASRFESAGAGRVRLVVEESAARYPITIDPIAQQAYVKVGDAGYGGVNDQFGYSVAVSGDTVIVGAPSEDSSTTGINSTPDELASGAGAAYVFVRSGTTWSQQAYLKASQVTANDTFGYSVAVSGDTVVVGAYQEDSSTTGINSTPNEGATAAGAAYIFTGLGASATAPTVNTPTSASVTASTATLGGSVDSDGGASITARGVVFSKTSLNNNPLIGGANVTNVTASGTTGVFTTSATSLAAHTGYTFKAYATNSVGTTYTSTATFTTLNTLPTAPAGSTTGTTGDQQTYTVSFPATDADGDAVSITSAASGTGVTVNSFTGTSVTFTPSTSFTGSGSFTYTVSDGIGTATGTITVTVTDNDAPVVAAHANVAPVEATSASGATVTYAAGSASDNVGVTSLTYSQNSGTTFPIGTTTVTITATDAASNTGTSTFTVTVQDTTAPVVAAHANVTVDATSAAGAVVTYAAGSASDAVGVTSLTYSQNSGTTFPIGTTTVTITAKDAVNNTGTGTFTVTVLSFQQSWRQLYFGTTSNTGNAADTADWDSDGVTDLAEFGFGTLPDNNSSGPPVIEVTSGAITRRGTPTVNIVKSGTSFTYNALFGRRKDWATAGLTFTVQFSGDLATWYNSTATPTVIADDGTVEAVTVRYPFFVGGKKAQFFRVAVGTTP